MAVKADPADGPWWSCFPDDTSGWQPGDFADYAQARSIRLWDQSWGAGACRVWLATHVGANLLIGVSEGASGRAEEHERLEAEYLANVATGAIILNPKSDAPLTAETGIGYGLGAWTGETIPSLGEPSKELLDAVRDNVEKAQKLLNKLPGLPSVPEVFSVMKVLGVAAIVLGAGYLVSKFR